MFVFGMRKKAFLSGQHVFGALMQVETHTQTALLKPTSMSVSVKPNKTAAQSVHGWKIVYQIFSVWTSCAHACMLV